jgi:predicted peroxiredoxin
LKREEVKKVRMPTDKEWEQIVKTAMTKGCACKTCQLVREVILKDVEK